MADAASTAPLPQSGIALGLRENWQQFTLLVLINAFVGGMVGLERTLVPLIGSETFQLASTAAVTSFIVSFGIVKGSRFRTAKSGQTFFLWNDQSGLRPIGPRGSKVEDHAHITTRLLMRGKVPETPAN